MESKQQNDQILTNVLGKNQFYHHSMTQLIEILKLLQMPQTTDAQSILRLTKIGFLKLYEEYFQNNQKDKFFSYVCQQKFSSVSKQTKQFVNQTLNQLHAQIAHKNQQKSMMNMMYMPPNGSNPYYGYSMPGSNGMGPMMGMPPGYMNPSSTVDPTKNMSQQAKKLYENNNQAAMYQYYYGNYIDPNGYHPSMGHNMPRNVPRSPYHGYPMGSNPYQGSGYMNSPYGMQYPPLNMPPGYNSAGNYINKVGGVEPNSNVPPKNYPGYPGFPNQQRSTSPAKKSLNQPPLTTTEKSPKPYQKPQQAKSSTSLNKNSGIKHSRPGRPSNSTNKSTNSIQNTNYPASNIIKQQNKALLVQNDRQDNLNFLPRKIQLKDVKRLEKQNLRFKNCACKGYYQCQDFFTCITCEKQFHFKCTRLPIRKKQENKQQIYCAHCKMRQIDPLNNVERVLGEYYLMNLAEASFQTIVNFRIYQQFFKQKNSRYDIQIRCIRSGEQMSNLQITWPDQCIIKMNGQKIIDVPALQCNSSLKKRKDYSVALTSNIYGKHFNITNNSQTTAHILERITITMELKSLTPQQISQKKLYNDNNFALGLYLVKKYTIDQLYDRIRTQDHQHNKDFIKNLMNAQNQLGSEVQVEIDRITVRLLDPYSWDLIVTPVRGIKCRHAQCFDLKTFLSLMYSAKNRTWKCPVCSKQSRKFMIDYQQMELLKKAGQITPTPKEVDIFKEGKVAFKIQKDSSDDQGQADKQLSKTKKIHKEKKQQRPKQQNQVQNILE